METEGRNERGLKKNRGKGKEGKEEVRSVWKENDVTERIFRKRRNGRGDKSKRW